MLNYFPIAWRYPLGAMDGDDPEWGARLAGFFLLVQGVLILLHPLIATLRFGTRLAFGVLGLPALMGGGPLSLTLVFGALLVAVGLGILARQAWADWLGLGLALLLYVPRMDLPLMAGAGLLICYALGRRRWAAMKADGRPADAQPDGT